MFEENVEKHVWSVLKYVKTYAESNGAVHFAWNLQKLHVFDFGRILTNYPGFSMKIIFVGPRTNHTDVEFHGESFFDSFRAIGER